MSDLLKQAAVRVGTAYGEIHSDEKQFALDPSSLLVWLELIKEVVALWQDCRKSGVEAQKDSESPGIIERWALRRKVKETMGNRLFRQHGEQTIRAMLKAGKDASPEFLQALIDEV